LILVFRVFVWFFEAIDRFIMVFNVF
jgi:hypothetical protein